MIVLSASRRTDIPAFYMDWFMAGIRAGAFQVENPYNGRVSRVPADPGRVAAIVFWSKNYHAFLEGATPGSSWKGATASSFTSPSIRPMPYWNPDCPVSMNDWSRFGN